MKHPSATSPASPPRQPSRLAWATLAALAVGCAQIDLYREPTAEPPCEADGDCAGSLVCQAERCVDPATESLSVAIQLRYPNLEDHLLRQLTGMTFEPGLPMPDLEPLQLVPVRVVVTRSEVTVAATVGFRAQRGIPGTAIEVWGAAGERLELLPGEYEVTVLPAPSTRMPAATYRGVVVEATDNEELTVTVPLVRVDEGERLVALDGKVLLEYLDTGKEVPAEHVRIVAQSEDGQDASQPVVTCEQGDVCDGTFELILPAQTATETRAYRIVVQPTERNDTIPQLVLRRFEIGPEQFAAATETTTDSIKVSGPAYTFRARSIPPFVTRRGTVLGADGEPVSGALVSADARWGDTVVTATTATLTTDAGGGFELRLPDFARLAELEDVDRALVVTVAVEQASRWSSGSFERDPTATDAIAVRLSPKLRMNGRVAGRVLTEPIGSVAVRAEPVAGGQGASTSTLTQEDGSFELRLEPATYQLTLVPPPGSGLPRLADAVVVGDRDLDESFLLGRSSVAFGRVLDFDGEAAPGVSVEVFAHDLERDRAVLIGTGTTDDRGVYRVIVPNPDGFDYFAGTIVE